MFIYPYKQGSKSVNALSKSVELKKIKLENSRFRGSPNKVVLNWGASRIDNPQVIRCRVLNSPAAVAIAANKLAFLSLINGQPYCPPFTTDIEQAHRWAREGHRVVCRTVLNGHSGQGIVLADGPENVVQAPLYVKYIKKQAEWRVHIFNQKVIDVQRKVKDPNVPDNEINWAVRSHENGFIYVRNGIDTHPSYRLASDTALHAVNKVNEKGVELLFGAVDVIWNERQNRCYVLEINTAPGLEGQTVESYANAIKEMET